AIDVFFEDVKINPNKVILDLYLPELKAGDRIVAKEISLKVLGKDKICIIGENGTGKTTLMRRIHEALQEREDLKVGYMPQNYDEMMDMSQTPLSFLWDGKIAEERSRVQSCLGALKFTTEEMEHRIGDLSEGQKCKILLLKLILDRCDVLLLDEPTRNLSPLSNPRIRSILKEYKGTIIAVSHDRKFIEEVADRICLLKDGQLTVLD
ncbi:MAG: ABC-F family ATP-binding cassette domain-containing protein, partial [Erysipelotrichaceae bacterium]|nr:ABC-F family ATP-binding cassette domain-containing protein [Erysipelotrichaceae bacterium]